MTGSAAGRGIAGFRLYRTTAGPVVEQGGRRIRLVDLSWDALVNDADLYDRLATAVGNAPDTGRELRPLAPIESQEVWAAGVTYLRSRTARIEESKDAGGGDFYDRVYGAERPELFFKATARRVVGPGDFVRVRHDSTWSVPEPELALVVNARGTIVGYTIGNDMSARDIEGENPLYLPQAKIYAESCSLGPCVFVCREALPPDTAIHLAVTRGGAEVFRGQTALSQMRRRPEELIAFLFRENSFPDGCILLTGTGVVPPDDFTLRSGDVIQITIPPIGTLENTVR
ncbi:MAG: 2-hydroxyhepta-2,4-diene-1,7-dioate isomerase [Acidobacteria bacterium]|nr:MAG: 2-hydroxyhepta-2,4-diene-1,7-dioate isomerase [Acidobacteriota bacterium]